MPLRLSPLRQWTNTEGWKLFCERLNIPPFLLLKEFPGFERLHRVLGLTEKFAFVSEGFLRWMNERRLSESPELTPAPLGMDWFANAYEAAFRDRVKWWSG